MMVVAKGPAVETVELVSEEVAETAPEMRVAV
jgi:hypothetical protein